MAQFGRGQPFRPHLAGPIVGPSIVAVPRVVARVYSQAGRRSTLVRNPPRAHLSGPVIPLQTTITLPRNVSTLHTQAVERSRLVRKPGLPHLASPVIGSTGSIPIVTTGLIVLDPPKRVYYERNPHPPLLAPAIVGSNVVIPAPLVINARQGLLDTGLRRFAGSKRLVPPRSTVGILPIPSANGIYITNATNFRPAVLRNAPLRPHLVGANLTQPPPASPVSIGVFATNIARFRGSYGRKLIGAHLPPRTLTQPIPRAPVPLGIIRLQSVPNNRFRKIPTWVPHVGAPPTPSTGATFYWLGKKHTNITVPGSIIRLKA